MQKLPVRVRSGKLKEVSVESFRYEQSPTLSLYCPLATTDSEDRGHQQQPTKHTWE